MIPCSDPSANTTSRDRVRSSRIACGWPRTSFDQRTLERAAAAPAGLLPSCRESRCYRKPHPVPREAGRERAGLVDLQHSVRGRGGRRPRRDSPERSPQHDRAARAAGSSPERLNVRRQTTTGKVLAVRRGPRASGHGVGRQPGWTCVPRRVTPASHSPGASALYGEHMIGIREQGLRTSYASSPICELRVKMVSPHMACFAPDSVL
jgi:hypothetical protein